MQKLLETLKIIEGEIQHVAFHQARMQHSCKELGIASVAPDLTSILSTAPQQGEYRARIIYQQQIEHVEYFPIQPRVFKMFKVITADNLVYSHKFLERTDLNTYYAARGLADDVLLVKAGFITDTSIANVAFWDSTRWITPHLPLLQGTTRARLLQQGQLTLAEITPAMLPQFEKMALLNTMLGFYPLESFEII